MGAAGARRRRRVGGRRTGGLAQGQPLGGVSRLAEPGGVTVKESLCSFTKDYSLSTFFGVNKWQTSKLVVSRYWISNCHIHNGIRTIAHLRAAIRLSTLCTGRGSANLGRFRAHKRATVPAAPPPTRSQLALGSCACHVAGGGGDGEARIRGRRENTRERVLLTHDPRKPSENGGGRGEREQDPIGERGRGRWNNRYRVDGAAAEEDDLPVPDLFDKAYFARLHLIS
jgi:hypothetical protein